MLFRVLYVEINNFVSNARWKQQLQKKQDEAESTKYTNKVLVHNILPAHVGKVVCEYTVTPRNKVEIY